MRLQQELLAKLDLSGKGKKKSAAEDGDKKKEGKKKGKKGKKKSKKGKGSEVVSPAPPIDISAFDPADMSGRYKLDLAEPAAVQVRNPRVVWCCMDGDRLQGFGNAVFVCGHA